MNRLSGAGWALVRVLHTQVTCVIQPGRPAALDRRWFRARCTCFWGSVAWAVGGNVGKPTKASGMSGYSQGLSRGQNSSPQWIKAHPRTQWKEQNRQEERRGRATMRAAAIYLARCTQHCVLSSVQSTSQLINAIPRLPPANKDKKSEVAKRWQSQDSIPVWLFS